MAGFDTDIQLDIVEETPIAIEMKETGAPGTPGTPGGVTSVNGDTGDVVLTQDDVEDGTDNKQFSAAEQTKLAGIAPGAEVNTIEAGDGLAALDSAAATKLAGIATGANVGVVPNGAITGATKTKITYDSKGLVTGGTDATQDDIGDGTTNKQYSATDKTKLAGIASGADVTATQLPVATHAATGKTTPVDADELPIADSAASYGLKKLTWANLKATLKTYFDSLTTTFTNKRITPRVGTTASSATPTINTDNYDIYGLTALAANITSFTTNLTGTPTAGQKLRIYIVPTATRTIAWGASFEDGAAELPTSTDGTNRLDVLFEWNDATSKWRCMGSSIVADSGGSGDVSGGSSSTDNAIARYDGTTGKLLQNSGVLIADDGSISETYSGAGTNHILTLVMDSTDASHAALNAKNATNYAHAGNIILAQMMNASDTGDVVRIEGNGTGKNISSRNGSTETMSVDKAGNLVALTVQARRKLRSGTAASSATPTINTDNVDIYTLTALAANITSMTTNLSGTPAVGDELMIGFKDNGSARTIAHGASFVASGVAPLLTTTVAGKQHWAKYMWDGAHWVCMAVDATGY